ncbi:MAG: CopG family transcriptional regulator [Firmicutes bacterium ML8_F2]|jgi:predicted DNA-binding protein|nr:MAG: CopG family transcriptional regulator [Firmicutes bacterium ML8_F2]
MNKTNTITVRIPEELKLRIEKISKKQGVSMNQFAMYALTKEAGELEANEWFKNYLKGKNRKELYESFSEALEVVQERPVPDWDR